MTHVKLAGLMLVAGAVAAGCSGSNGPDDNRCEEALAFQITPTTTPTFAWSPACTIAQVRVANTWNDGEMWSVVGNGNSIPGPVGYGTVPSGATQTHAPELLLADSTYRLVVAILDPETSELLVAGSVNFTPQP